MTYYEDLTPYRYSETAEPSLVNVGWLAAGKPYRTGSPPSGLLEGLKLLMRDPRNVYRGIHLCELCPSDEVAEEYVDRDGLFSGSGEIHVSGKSGLTYVSPVLIAHYVECHQYLPPEPFVREVTDWYEIQSRL